MQEASGTGQHLWPTADGAEDFSFDIQGASQPMRLRCPKDTFPITPASCVFIDAISTHAAQLLKGEGVDWGCGGGCGAIACCMASPSVTHVWGLDAVPENVELARENAESNGITAAEFHLADSFVVAEEEAEARFAAASPLDFIVANAPADHEEGSDSFGWRRRIATMALPMLKPEGVLLLQALSAYGDARFGALATEGLRWEGTLHRHGPVEMDLSRPDLRDQLHQYAAWEEMGGEAYVFEDAEGQTMTAREALARWQASKEDDDADEFLPWVYWTVQHFVRECA